MYTFLCACNVCIALLCMQTVMPSLDPVHVRHVCTDMLLLSVAHSVGRQLLKKAEGQCLATVLRCLASPSAVCSYFGQDVVELISLKLENGSRLDDAFFAAFNLASPIMASMCRLFHARGFHNSLNMPIWRVFWEELCRLSLFCHTGFDAGPLLPVCPTAVPSCEQAYIESGICSGLVQVRERFPCALDSHGNSERTTAGCRHEFEIKKDRTGGVFTIFCCHGICIAFFILPNAEGRSDVYSYIVKHFAVAPKLIVYDFACKLEDFCINRAPAYFIYTQFGIDRLHTLNHRTCGPGYFLDEYPQYDFLNTQIAEQCNSALSRVQDAAKCMGQVAYMLNLGFYLSMWNGSKELRLDAQKRFLDRMRNG